MNIQGLKPCPFCGGNAIEVSPYDQKPLGSRWIIKCVDCGASIQGSHRAMNKAAWNQRAHEPRTGECRTCKRNADNGGVYDDGRTKCPIQEHYALLLDGYCHLYEQI